MDSPIERNTLSWVRARCAHVLAALLCCAGFLAHAKQPGLVLEVGAWPPYIDFAAANNGAVSKIVLDAFAAAGVSARVKEVSWKAAEERIGEREAVSFGWIKTPERVARWRYSDAICTSTTFLVSRRSAPVRWANLADLKGMKVGWSRGYSYGDKFDALRPNLQVFEMPSDEIGLRRLLAGSVDAMPMDSLVAKELLQSKFSKAEAAELYLDVRPEQAIARADLHVVCDLRASACAKTLALFNQGLTKTRKSRAVASCAAD